jgi:hypothetical protein
MLKNKRTTLLLIGTTALVVGGGAATYFLLGQQNFFRGNAPVGSQLIPQDALVTASISTDSEQWQQLRKYGTPEIQTALNKQLSQLQNNLLIYPIAHQRQGQARHKHHQPRYRLLNNPT